jgi:pimeloyl-ACP methyl ester carboxylesterase
LLTVSFELWKAGYHVLVYDLRGHGESPVDWCGLGTYEKDDLISALEFLKSQKDPSGQDLLDGRVGLYGVDLGGYVSLAAAGQNPMVKAIAVDSVCPDVPAYLNHRLKHYIGGGTEWANQLIDSSLSNRITDLVMRGYLMKKEQLTSAVEVVKAPAGRKLLFITGKDSGPLAPLTRDLYAKTADQKLLVEVDRTRLSRLYDKHSTDYDDRIVAFFREAIPTAPEKAQSTARASR